VAASDGAVTMIADTLKTPNGLALTLDERVLLVDDTEQNEIFAFELTADGRAAGPGRVFARLRDIKPGERSYADGMAMDADGRLYVTSTPGVQVFDPKGEYLGTIPIPTQPSSVAFSGPDARVLYVTARQNLYRVKMLSRGPTRPGQK
jgi:gluconolactonase